MNFNGIVIEYRESIFGMDA